MKMTGILLGALFTCFAGSVYSNDRFIELFTLQPIFPQQGGELTVYYNTNHKDCRFANKSDLYLTVNVLAKDSVYILRMPMQYMQSEDSICFVSLRVPDDAVYLCFEVGKYGNTAFVNTISVPVFSDSDIVQGAAGYHILNCSSYEEARRVFTIDQELYPESYESVAPLWNGMLDADIMPKEILKTADSLYNTLSSCEWTDRGQIAQSVACIVAYQRSGQYTKLHVLLRLLSESMRNRRVSLGAFPELMLGGVVARMLDAYGAGRVYSDSDMETFVRSVCDICITGRSMRLLNDLFMHSGPNFNKRSKEIRGIIKAHPAWDFIKNLAFDISENEFMNGGVVLHIVIDECYKQGEYQYCIDAAKALNQRLDACLEWTRTHRDGVVSLTPGYGMESPIRLLQAKSYFQVGDSVNAVKLYSWMAARDPNKVYYQWALYESARALSQYYAEKGNRDSSATYIGLLYSTNAPQSDETYNKAKKCFGTGYYTFDEILSKFYHPSSAKQVSAPDVEIETTDGKNEAVGKECSGLLLLITTRGCGICRLVVPPLIEQFAQDEVADRIIVMTDYPDYQWAPSAAGKTMDDVRFADMDNDLLSKLDIPGYPCYFYFKNGAILSSGGVNDLTYTLTRKISEDAPGAGATGVR